LFCFEKDAEILRALVLLSAHKKFKNLYELLLTKDSTEIMNSSYRFTPQTTKFITFHNIISHGIQSTTLENP
jgi:hypothetical protein